MMNGVSGSDSDGYNHWSEMKPAQPKSLSPPQPQKQLSDSYSNTLPVRKNVPPKNSYASGEALTSLSGVLELDLLQVPVGQVQGTGWRWFLGVLWGGGSDRQCPFSVKCCSCLLAWALGNAGAGLCPAVSRDFQEENLVESGTGNLLPLPWLVGDAKSLLLLVEGEGVSHTEGFSATWAEIRRGGSLSCAWGWPWGHGLGAPTALCSPS